MKTMKIGALIFPGFELLDLFGPLEMFGLYPENFDIRLVAETGDPVTSSQKPVSLPDHSFADDERFDLLLVPGGKGTRQAVHQPVIMEWLQKQSESARLITSVCTGSALLAQAGILDGRRATTNKNAFNWVSGFGNEVEWIRQARWVQDGNIYTSSGVSAGTDMSLAVIADVLGMDKALQAADWAEYFWNEDPGNDPFAVKAGLVPDR